MSEQELATCHCIIGHPSKPKFLVVKHSDGWNVPVLKFPPGHTDYIAKNITDGMQRKYGLKTRVLRPLVSAPSYHCIELELPETSAETKLHAVWVDREQYLKGRSERNGAPDPFGEWLVERESGTVPKLRSPWQMAGWFEQADVWIHFQAEKLGIQLTGSVYQYRSGWNASCLLAVPSSQGPLYFKSGYSKPPGEAALTSAMATKWPETIFKPLAADLDRNWMLNEDFRSGGKVSPAPATFPSFARVLARVQVESSENIAGWLQLGCPRHDLNYLLEQIKNKDDLLPILQDGYDRLNDDELRQFARALGSYSAPCQDLQQIGIPDALIHGDFRDDNLVLKNDQCRIMDWADVVIGHPFMALQVMYSQQAKLAEGQENVRARPDFTEAVLEEMTVAYLEEYQQIAPQEKLQQAWRLARTLFPVWKLYGNVFEIQWAEQGGPRFMLLQAQIQRAARDLQAAGGWTAIA